MTGYFIRIISDNNIPVNIEIENLSDKQLNEFISRMNAYEAKRWLTALVVWIRDNVKEESKTKFTKEQIHGELP